MCKNWDVFKFLRIYFSKITNLKTECVDKMNVHFALKNVFFLSYKLSHLSICAQNWEERETYFLAKLKKRTDHSNPISSMTPEDPINGIEGSCHQQIVS